MACTVAVEEVISEHYDKWAIQNSFYWTQTLFYKTIFYVSVWISYKVPVLSLYTVNSKEPLLTLPTHEAYD